MNNTKLTDNAPTADSINQKITKESAHFDSDHRFMAAQDLCDWILKGYIPESQYEAIVLNVFLKQLEDPHPDVQSNAIHSLTQVISRMNEKLINTVAETLIRIIIKADTKAELRDVYVNCVMSLIRDISDENAQALQPILELAISGIDIKRKTQDFKGEKELIEIITNLFTKRARIFGGVAFNHEDLINKLEFNIFTDGIHTELRQKSATALGEISIVFRGQEVSNSCAQILAKLKETNFKDFTKDNFIGQFCLSSLNSITKSSGLKVTAHAVKISEFIINQLGNMKNDYEEDVDHIFKVSDYLEDMLHILKNLIEGVSGDTLDTDTVQQIINVSRQMLTYDPNNCASPNMEIEDGEEGDQDDEYDDGNNDDPSWKVRKASLNVIDRVIELRFDALPHVIQSCVTSYNPKDITLMNKLSEQNENVRNATLNAIQNLIKSCVYQDTTTENNDSDESGGAFTLSKIKSSFIKVDFDDIINKTLNEIKKIVSRAERQKTNSSLIVSCFKLIENVSRNMGRIIIESKQITNHIFQLLRGVLKTSQNIDIVFLSLSSVRKLLKSKSEQTNFDYLFINLDNFFGAAVALIKNPSTHTKIKAEAFKLVSTALQSHFFTMMGKDLEKNVQEVIPLVIEYLKKTDIDQEIKVAVIRTTSTLIKRHNSLIVTQDISTILSISADQIKTETKKLQVLRLLKLLPINLTLTEQSANKLQDIVAELSNLLLKSGDMKIGGEDKEIKPMSVEALHTVLSLMNFNQKPLDSKIVALIITNSTDLINENEIYLSQNVLHVIQILMVHAHKDNKPDFKRLTDKINKLLYSQEVENIGMPVLFEVVGLFVQHGLWESKEVIGKLNKDLKKENLQSISKAIASIIKSDSKITKEQIDENRNLALKPVSSSDEPAYNLKLTAILTLANLGKLGVISSNPIELIQSFVQVIKDDSEKSSEVKNFAAIAIGSIGLCDIESCIQILFPSIEDGTYNQFYFLNALKEIISELPSESKAINQIVPFLFKLTEKDSKESVIISECLGKIGRNNLELVKSKLFEGLESQNPKTRNTTADSLKEIFARNKESEDLKELAHRLLKLIADPDVDETRLSVLRILTSVILNCPNLISKQINKSEFFDPLFKSLEFDKTKVQTVDLGAFKHVVDGGDQLRKAAFDLLNTTLDQLYHRVVDNETDILKATFNLFKEDISDEVKLQRIKVFITIASHSKQQFIPFLDQAHKVFLAEMAQIKDQKTEKAIELKRAFTKITMILQTFAAEEKHADYLKFYGIVLSTNEYKVIIEALQIESVQKK